MFLLSIVQFDKSKKLGWSWGPPLSFYDPTDSFWCSESLRVKGAFHFEKSEICCIRTAQKNMENLIGDIVKEKLQQQEQE